MVQVTLCLPQWMRSKYTNRALFQGTTFDYIPVEWNAEAPSEVAYWLTPAAAAKAADCGGGIVLTGGGSAKEESLALMAPE
jgi:hypothetical protein